MFPSLRYFLHIHTKAQREQCDHVRHAGLHKRIYQHASTRVCIPTHSHTRTRTKAYAVRKINTITKNRKSITYNYFLLQPLFWMRGSPRWCFGASVMSLVTDSRVSCGKRLSFLRRQFVAYLITILSWSYVGFRAAGMHLRHPAKVHMPPASLLPAQHWSGIYCACSTLIWDLLWFILSNPPVSFLLYSGLLFCFSALSHIFYSFAFIDSSSRASFPRFPFLSRPPGHLAAPEIWYWNVLSLRVSKRHRKGENEVKAWRSVRVR